jgi:hypothetical protein
MYYLKALKEYLEENTPNSLILLFSILSTFHSGGLPLIFEGYPILRIIKEISLELLFRLFPICIVAHFPLRAGTRLMHNVHYPAW